MRNNVTVLGCVEGKEETDRYVKILDDDEQDDDDELSWEGDDEDSVYVTPEGGLSSAEIEDEESDKACPIKIPSCSPPQPDTCPPPPPSCSTPSPSGCPPRSPAFSCIASCPVPSLSDRQEAFMKEIAEFQESRRRLVEDILGLAPPSEFVEEV